MKKSDLRTGMIVQMRDGEFYIVMIDVKINGLCKNIIVHIKDGKLRPMFDSLSSYTEEFIAKGYGVEDLNIDRVYAPTTSKIGYLDSYVKIWDRNSDALDTKDMTLDEIERELGYKVRIVN